MGNTRLKFAYSIYKELQPGIGKNCSIDKDVMIGAGTQICDNVVIKSGVLIGKDCLILSGTVIGEKGFGFARDENNIPIRISHTGGVIIGDDVEIGTLNSIMAGTIEPTIIENHVKIDSHVHVAHNDYIGEKTIIASNVVFAGSVKIGKNCFFGINSSVKNKITIADNTIVGQQANVVKDIIHPNTTVIGNPAHDL